MVQVYIGWNAHWTTARRHAGGVAATKLARAVMTTKTKLDGYMASVYYFRSSRAVSRRAVGV